VRIEDRMARNPFVLMAWPTPPRYAAEDAAGEVAAALLGDLTASRLEQALPGSTLVETTQLGLLSGTIFQIALEPPAGQSLEALAHAIDGVLAALGAQPPAQAEVDAGVRRLIRARLRALEEPLPRAMLLADLVGDARAPGDPLAWERQRCQAVTAAQVRDFAARYLVPDRRVTVLSTPAGGRR
jgi:predicted Zn-dependent peptidase